MVVDASDLARRLEAAESGSDELSREVLLALGWTPQGIYWAAPGNRIWLHPCRPTQSVDDGLALLREMSGRISDLREGSRTWIRLYIPRPDRFPEAWGSTIALALSAALLRAHEAGGEKVVELARSLRVADTLTDEDP